MKVPFGTFEGYEPGFRRSIFAYQLAPENLFDGLTVYVVYSF